MALQYLSTTLTQGSADAFIQASIATPIDVNDANAMRIREVLLDRPAFTSGNHEVTIALTRVSVAAIPDATTLGLIAMTRRRGVQASGVGFFINEDIVRLSYTEDDNVLVVDPLMYAQMDSTGTSASNVCRIRIGYELTKISVNEKLALRISNLTA